ncbi:MAG: OmpA family protein [Bacteroidota bacterium]
MKSGDRFYTNGDFESAIRLYKKAERQKPGNAKVNLKIGLSYLSGEEKTRAIPYLEKVHSLNPNLDPDIDFYLAMAYQHDHQFKKAISLFTTYKDKYPKMTAIANRRLNECNLGDSLINNPVPVEISNLNSVNSEFHDYSPLVTADAKTMVFTSRRAGTTGNKKDVDNHYFEDIYITKLNGEEWNAPSKISSNINFDYHDAAAAISPDGKTLFLYYEDGGGDIFVSNYNGDDWQAPFPLKGDVNTEYWETAVTITGDGKTLYFTSDRPGGFGGLDIYMSQLNENGIWGKAVNLGPDINSTGHEDSPFIHPDGKTLYFSSKGHLGLGGYDIFKSELKDGLWQAPINLGYPINTANDDGHFVICEDGKQAYYTSVRKDGVGMTDIYSVSMNLEDVNESTGEETVKVVENQEELDEEEEYNSSILDLQKTLGVVTLLRGKVLDAADAKPIGASISLVDNAANKVMKSVTADPVTGEFEVTIPHGGNFGLTAEMDGYLFRSINFNVPVFHDYQEVDAHMLLVRAEAGSRVILKNIFFDSGKSNLRVESLSELGRIQKLMEDNPKLKIQIHGHTDNVGNATYNKILSKKRAQAVVDYLINHGIKTARVEAKGFGEERPLVSNDDEIDGREINRRTEIEIIEN